MQCIEPHAPLKHITLTRSPAPRLKIYKMRQIKQLRGKLWFETHETKAQEIWQKLHDVPNLPKEKKWVKLAKIQSIKLSILRLHSGMAGYLPYATLKPHTYDVQ